MPGRTPAAAGDADAGVGAPNISMTHTRRTLSVIRWPDRVTGIRALYVSPGGVVVSAPAWIGAHLAAPHRHAVDDGVDRLKIRDVVDAQVLAAVFTDQRHAEPFRPIPNSGRNCRAWLVSTTWLSRVLVSSPDLGHGRANFRPVVR